MRYGIQHYNGKGEIRRTRYCQTAKVALERAPWIIVWGNQKPNPDRWRVVRFTGPLDVPVVAEVLAESPKAKE